MTILRYKYLPLSDVKSLQVKKVKSQANTPEAKSCESAPVVFVCTLHIRVHHVSVMFFFFFSQTVWQCVVIVWSLTGCSVNVTAARDGVHVASMWLFLGSTVDVCMTRSNVNEAFAIDQHLVVQHSGRYSRSSETNIHTEKFPVFLNMYESWQRCMPISFTVTGGFCVVYLCISAAFSAQQGRSNKKKKERWGGERESEWLGTALQIEVYWWDNWSFACPDWARMPLPSWPCLPITA